MQITIPTIQFIGPSSGKNDGLIEKYNNISFNKNTFFLVGA